MGHKIESDKVVLREIEEIDWLDIHKYASLPIVSQYQSWGPNKKEESQDFVKRIMSDAQSSPRSRFAFAVIEKERGKMIGSGELNIRDFDNNAGEIAYIFHPDYWGKGFATEAASLLIGFGFKEFQLHRIYATCDPRNIASSRVLEKIGMTKEGRMREDLLIKDGWRDSLLYSILESEWLERVGEKDE